MIRRFGVGAQLVLAFILVSVISISILLGVTIKIVSKSATDDALTLLRETALNYAGEFANFLEGGLALARSGRASLEAIKEEARAAQLTPDRQVAILHLRSHLKNNPWALATWTVWEPGLFDDRDAEFSGQPGHDQSGRLVPYIYKEGSEIILEPLSGYDQPGTGDYYLLARDSGKDVVLEPYEYDFSGRKALITSMTVPIREGQKVVGCAGADVSLEAITAMMADIKPMGVGQAILLSPGGVIVGHSDASLSGRNFRDTPRGRLLAQDVEQAMNSGRAQVKVIDGGWIAGSEDAAAAIYPFIPGDTGQRWVFLALVPMSKVLENAESLTRYGLLTGALALVVAIIIGLLSVKFIVGGLTRRITAVAEELEAIGLSLNREAGEINTSSLTISDGAQNQAASIEETSAAMEEISSMTKSTVTNANTANDGCLKTIELVGAGADDVRAMNEAMAEINQSTGEISHIIKTIEEIAFQTNLLALNASVEAARAGEAGAGFAVVADEVRNLALRSSDSVGNTENLIKTTIERVKNGAQVSGRLSESFGLIENSTRDISQLVAQITTAATEQDTGISQVRQAVQVMEKVTNENVTAVDELSRSTGQMSAQTGKMTEVIYDLLGTVGRQKG